MYTSYKEGEPTFCDSFKVEDAGSEFILIEASERVRGLVVDVQVAQHNHRAW